MEGLASSMERAPSLPVPLPDSADSGLKELAAAAQRYGQAASKSPGDYDAVYNHGLALQELATRLGSSQGDQLRLLLQVSLLLILHCLTCDISAGTDLSCFPMYLRRFNCFSRSVSFTWDRCE